jgi:ssDNA-binding Zn-finger/Zn-ribbon topoisomerase 1
MIEYAKFQKKKEDKKWVAEKKESLKTHSDWMQLLQIAFNTYIRLRDKDLPCISCGQNLQGKKTDASHFYSCGAYPQLRVDEDNVHNACVHCNQHKGGNLHEYRKRLPARIGQERFDALEERKQQELKLTLPEIKEKIAYYKGLIKELSGQSKN